MKRPEGEMIEAVEVLGRQAEAVWMDRQNVGSHQVARSEDQPRVAAKFSNPYP